MATEPPVFDARIMIGKGRLVRPVHVLLPLMPDPNPPDANLTYIRATFPEGDDRHIVFGEFIDQWGKIENALFELVQKLLDTDHTSTRAIMSATGNKQTRDLLASLGASKLFASDAKKLDGLTARLGRLATRRNNLIHGRWWLEAIVHADKTGEPVLETRWVRQYDPPDAPTRAKLQKLSNQRERTRYCFTLQDIGQFANDIVSLRDDFMKFANQAVLVGNTSREANR